MAQIAYRGNLSASNFPLLSQGGGQTVIVPGPDNNFNRQVQSSADLDKDVGIPQAYYMHNVLPTAGGLQSVGYDLIVTGPYSPDTLAREFILREDASDSKLYIFQPGVIGTTVFFLSTIGLLWSAVSLYYVAGVPTVFPNDIYNRQFTVAHVEGVSYLQISNLVTLKYNFTLNRLESVTLAGLAPVAILGLVEASGYLIAYSDSTVAWSSTLNPLDFVPSLETGAGGGSVEGIKGIITAVASSANGFMVYSKTNAVSVLFTGNTRYPFQFSECLGAGGVVSLERVTYESDSGFNYAYTTKGFQLVQARLGQTIMPEITDFLGGRYFEDFDETTNTFVVTITTTPLVKKIGFIASRYLVISYGITTYTHAIVYDTVQKKFGKLKIEHVDCFEFEYLDEAVNDIPKKSIAFITSSGTISTVNFDVGSVTRIGVLVLGKFQYARSRRMQLQEAWFEWINPNSTLEIYNCVTQDGKTLGPLIPGVILKQGTNVRQYGFGSPDGVNHTLIAKGTFNFVSYELKFNITGNY